MTHVVVPNAHKIISECEKNDIRRPIVKLRFFFVFFLFDNHKIVYSVIHDIRDFF